MRLSLIISLLSFGLLGLSSCATILNTDTTPVNIVTSQASKITVGGDTVLMGSNVEVEVHRSDQPLQIVAATDSTTKTIAVEPINSTAYWLNLYPNYHFWAGFLIDRNKMRRYSYPKTIFLDLESRDSAYLTYLPWEFQPAYQKHVVKITPLKLVGIVHPSVEAQYEYSPGAWFSTQVKAGVVLPGSVWDKHRTVKRDSKGFTLGLEEKLYLQRSAPTGPYIGLEGVYEQIQSTEVWRFGEESWFNDTLQLNYADTFGVNRQTLSFNLKFGWQVINQRIAVDAYVGLGARYRNVSHSDRLNPAHQMEGTRHPSIHWAALSEGEYWTISFPLNLSIGYTF